MEAVLIDRFVVPAIALNEFLEHVHRSARIIRTLPGFVEGYVFRLTSGDDRVNVVTTAVWASSSAMEDAKIFIAAEYAKVGFEPKDIMKRLDVQIERGIYQRAPY